MHTNKNQQLLSHTPLYQLSGSSLQQQPLANNLIQVHKSNLSKALSPSRSSQKSVGQLRQNKPVPGILEKLQMNQNFISAAPLSVKHNYLAGGNNRSSEFKQQSLSPPHKAISKMYGNSSISNNTNGTKNQLDNPKSSMDMSNQVTNNYSISFQKQVNPTNLQTSLQQKPIDNNANNITQGRQPFQPRSDIFQTPQSKSNELNSNTPINNFNFKSSMEGVSNICTINLQSNTQTQPQPPTSISSQLKGNSSSKSNSLYQNQNQQPQSLQRSSVRNQFHTQPQNLQEKASSSSSPVGKQINNSLSKNNYLSYFKSMQFGSQSNISNIKTNDKQINTSKSKVIDLASNNSNKKANLYSNPLNLCSNTSGVNQNNSLNSEISISPSNTSNINMSNYYSLNSNINQSYLVNNNNNTSNNNTSNNNTIPNNNNSNNNNHYNTNNNGNNNNNSSNNNSNNNNNLINQTQNNENIYFNSKGKTASTPTTGQAQKVFPQSISSKHQGNLSSSNELELEIKKISYGSEQKNQIGANQKNLNKEQGDANQSLNNVNKSDIKTNQMAIPESILKLTDHLHPKISQELTNPYQQQVQSQKQITNTSLVPSIIQTEKYTHLSPQIPNQREQQNTIAPVSLQDTYTKQAPAVVDNKQKESILDLIKMESIETKDNSVQGIKKEMLRGFSQRLSTSKSDFQELQKQIEKQRDNHISEYHANLEKVESIERSLKDIIEDQVKKSKQMLLDCMNSTLGVCRDTSFTVGQILNYLGQTENDLLSNLGSILNDMDVSSLKDIINQYDAIIDSYNSSKNNTIVHTTLQSYSQNHSPSFLQRQIEDCLNQLQKQLQSILTFTPVSTKIISQPTSTPLIISASQSPNALTPSNNAEMKNDSQSNKKSIFVSFENREIYNSQQQQPHTQLSPSFQALPLQSQNTFATFKDILTNVDDKYRLSLQSQNNPNQNHIADSPAFMNQDNDTFATCLPLTNAFAQQDPNSQAQQQHSRLLFKVDDARQIYKYPSASCSFKNDIEGNQQNDNIKNNSYKTNYPMIDTASGNNSIKGEYILSGNSSLVETKTKQKYNELIQKIQVRQSQTEKLCTDVLSAAATYPINLLEEYQPVTKPAGYSSLQHNY